MNESSYSNPIDFSRIQETSGGDRGFEREIMTVYLSDTRERLNRLGELLRDGDVEGIRGLAHTIKGASSSVGATAVQRWAAKLETEAGATELSGAPALIQSLETALLATESFVEQHFTNPSNTA